MTKPSRRPQKRAKPTATVKVRILPLETGVTPEAAKAGASKQLDPFADQYGLHGLIEPPYPYAVVQRRYDDSDVLQSAVDAMTVNTCSFGVQFVPVLAAPPPALNDAIQGERERLKTWFDAASSVGSFTAARKRVRKDLAVFGDGYYEVLRDAKGRLVGLDHCPTYTMRKTRWDRAVVETARWVRGADGAFTKVTQYRRFRRFAQYVNGRMVWFKELGDPRPLRADTGDEDPNAAPQDLASEVLNLCRYEPGSVYGKPCWRGAASSAAGRAAAGEVNVDIFDNNAIPPMAILVQGATFDDDVIERLKEHFSTVKGRKNRHVPLILEAKSDATSDPADPMAIARPGAVPKIDFKDLTKAAQTDAQFLEYRNRCVEDVAMAFRLPPIFMGRSEEYNFATAQAARQVAEEQVFAPERADEDELLNSFVLPELGARHCRVITKGPPLLSEEQLLKVIEVGIKAGVLTVANVADLLEPLLGVELSSPESWRKVPAALLDALAKNLLLPADVTKALGEVTKVSGSSTDTGDGTTTPTEGGGGDGAEAPAAGDTDAGA